LAKNRSVQVTDAGVSGAPVMQTALKDAPAAATRPTTPASAVAPTSSAIYSASEHLIGQPDNSAKFRSK